MAAIAVNGGHHNQRRGNIISLSMVYISMVTTQLKNGSDSHRMVKIDGEVTGHGHKVT